VPSHRSTIVPNRPIDVTEQTRDVYRHLPDEHDRATLKRYLTDYCHETINIDQFVKPLLVLVNNQTQWQRVRPDARSSLLAERRHSFADVSSRTKFSTRSGRSSVRTTSTGSTSTC
jgi:hypothetical protein